MSTYWCFVAGDCDCSPFTSGDDPRSSPGIQINPSPCSQVQLAPSADAGDGDTSRGINATRWRRGVIVVVIALIGAVRDPQCVIIFSSSSISTWRAAGWARGWAGGDGGPVGASRTAFQNLTPCDQTVPFCLL